MNAASLPILWANCVNQLKDRINNRSFWEALEHTRAITIENGTLVLGLEAEEYTRASIINQVSMLHTVQEVVRQMFGQPLKVRIIEGLGLADWEAAKVQDASMAAMKEAAPAPRAVAMAASGWDSVTEQLSRLYAEAPFRALPQGKARYANEALYILVEAMDKLYPDGADEPTERNLARVLDRIANSSEIPAAVLAFELERLRAWRRAEAEASAA
ncbi:MAG: hypothetical protein JWL77_4665 [Chthonomonadaceae bacterium]|nr:hypothetical protein [Chthonomonadaceae bacterium]